VDRYSAGLQPMTYETDSKVIFVAFLLVFLALIGVAAYYGLSGDWKSFILGGVTVYLVGCIKIRGKSIHG
jgi:hypothetical protein